MYLELAGSLLLLLLGGETVVRGAVATAIRAGVSPLLIGLTLVGFGTSTPELLTSLEAAGIGAPGIAVGNVIGSNIANILLILGLVALLCPIAVTRAALSRDGSVAMVAAIACAIICKTGSLQPAAGVLLIMLLGAYVGWCFHTERVRNGSAESAVLPASAIPGSVNLSLPVSLALLGAGLAMTMLGAHLLIGSVLHIGARIGISESVLGLTVVAVGTSLPELVTSLLAARRHQPDIAFGNIIGSNIYNVLGILGVTAIFEPLRVPPELAAMDVWVMLGATVVLMVFAWTGWRISRIEGALFLLAYAAYVALTFIPW